jgi:glycosyltransferase involved in cell wall biosynthesis
VNPRFSVVIPAYNAAATLARALDSVVAQSVPAFEIVVVDDGSTDTTAAAAEAYAAAHPASPIRVIRQTNAGVAAARNAGATAASGDWLAFLDADDWYTPERLQYHADWIAVDPALDLVTGDYEYRDSDGKLLGTSMAQHDAGRRLLARGQARVMLDAPDDLRAFVADHFGDTHTLSVPRARFLQLGGYPRGFKVCEDVHLLVRLVAASRKLGVVCANHGVYLIHSGSATRKNPVAAQIENVRTLTDLVARSADLPAPIRHGVAERMASARYNLGAALAKSGQHLAAARAVWPNLVARPSLAALRVFFSMLKP